MNGAIPCDLHRACPLCNHDEATPVLTKGALRLVRCRHCSMVYADPIESGLASGRFYDRSAHYLSPDKLAGDFAPVRFERELRIFRRHCDSGRVLDVGCSTGAFLFQLNTRWPGAYSMVGTDVASGPLAYAESRGIRTVRDPFLEAQFTEARFDAVTFWAVMEHLSCPKQFLSRATLLLNPGGVCFILVPNLHSLAVRILREKYRYLMPDHLNYFTAETLKIFANSQPDLQIVEAGSTHFNPMVIWQDLRSRQHRVPDAARARLLQRTTAWKQKRWLTPVKVLYAGFELLLGAMHLADNLFIVLRKRPV